MLKTFNQRKNTVLKFNFNYLFLLYMLLNIMPTSYVHSAVSTIEAYDADIDLSRRKSLISGVPNDRILRDGKVVITLGFSSFHAYLVFELKNEDNIVVEGVHMGGRDYSGCFSSDMGAVCAGGSTQVRHEGTKDVLKKFVRAKQVRTRHGTIVEERELPSVYTKFRSFIVDDTIARTAWDITEEDSKSKKISFRLVGDAFSANAHNCCSYAAKVLRDCGIGIDFGRFYKPRSPKNLRDLIDAYEFSEGEGVPVQVHTPDPVAALLRRGMQAEIATYPAMVDERQRKILAFYSRGRTDDITVLDELREEAERDPLAKGCLSLLSKESNIEIANRYAGETRGAIRLEADAGNLCAKWILGCLLLYGLGGDKDTRESFRCFEEAAGEKFAPAQTFLALSYLEGLGTPRDLRRAVSLLEYASDQRYIGATYVLGTLYESGIGVSKNIVTAHSLYKRAAEAEYTRAKEKLRILVRPHVVA